MSAALIEAARAALAMLEMADCSTGYCCCGSTVDGHGIYDGHGPADDGDYHQMKAIEALRTALAAAEQPAKPVAWWIPKAEQFALAKKDGSRPFAKTWEPLYASPAAQAQAPLTDEQIDVICKGIEAVRPGRPGTIALEFARAIERAHGIGITKETT